MESSAENTHAGTVRKRDGREVEFDSRRVQTAMEKAFRAELNLADGQPLSSDVIEDLTHIVAKVEEAIRNPERMSAVTVEQIQDIVEIGLMKREHFRVARRYILYRTEHARIRAIRGTDTGLDSLNDSNHVSHHAEPRIRVELEPGLLVPFDESRIKRFLNKCPESKLPEVDTDEIVAEVVRGAFDGMTPDDVTRALVLATRSRIERDPAYDALAAQLQRSIVYRQSLGKTQFEDGVSAAYRDHFEHYVIEGVRANRLSGDLRGFDLHRIATALQPERDAQFRYLGMQTIFDRYL
ncbi:MAG: ATP cone domain-containing protein, partial [Rhodopirellula sp. JB055]|uniref:ATP cone domain-containing protein n=1 Tax=Rhodopirellula sp. JB055 TaxID=3342846 RepID=UPI00370C4856